MKRDAVITRFLSFMFLCIGLKVVLTHSENSWYGVTGMLFWTVLAAFFWQKANSIERGE
jgi:hypothetical protein